MIYLTADADEAMLKKGEGPNCGSMEGSMEGIELLKRAR